MARLACFLNIVLAVVSAVSLLNAGAFAGQPDGACVASDAKTLRKDLAAILRDLRDDTAKGYLTGEDESKIVDVYADESLPPNQRAEKAFGLVMEARLRGLPVEIADQVRAIIKSRIRVEVNNDYNGAYFKADVSSGAVKIDLPEELVGSPIQYSVMAHELEHAIQDAVAVNVLGKYEMPEHSLSLYTDAKFLMEAGAMSAEYYSLRLISPEERLICRNAILKADVPRSDRSILLRMLNNSKSMSLKQFLSAEHRAGNYSRLSIALHSRPGRRLVKKLGTATVWALGTGFIARAYCQLLYDNNNEQPLQTPFFQTVCTKIMRIGI